MPYEITVRHPELNKIRRITGQDKWLVDEKARVQIAAWNEQWRARCEAEERRNQREEAALLRFQKNQVAAQRTAEAEAALATCQNVLAQRAANQNIWKYLVDGGPSPDCPPERPKQPTAPDQPRESDSAFQPTLGFLDKLVPSRRQRRVETAAARFRSAHAEWQARKSALDAEYAKALSDFETDLQDWQERQERRRASVDDLKRRYMAGEADAIVEYFDTALSLSDYPDFCPKEFSPLFVSESGILLIDYRLPALSDMPTLKQVRYVASKNSVEERYLKPAEANGLYDSLLYQICLRTIFEVFGYDLAEVVKAVVFNGWVDYIDPANGKNAHSCIMSVQALRGEFLGINLDNVDPRLCFKALKGVGSSKLHAMAAVAPLLRLNRNDSRFIEGADVVEAVDEGTNLAAVGWEDFEFLIREIFEKEFSRNGGEVKVTRASRDGGVDAVAFDPDPIRGGKIVIQAKRYTNTVGVSAVRDLYGTVMNEGATKGILVTTASFGPDAYAFAKDKPLTLLDGGNLLYLLQQHGHKAYINLNEAKKLNVMPLKRSTQRS